MNIPLVAANTNKWISLGSCVVKQVFGNNAQATDLYIQFHQKPTVANGDVPAVKAVWVAASGPFSWTFEGGLSLAELLIAISTTAPSLTLVGANGGLDMTVVVEVDPAFLVTSATTISGDLTTGVASRQVWAQATGPKKLRRLDIKNNAGVDRLVVIQASDAALTTDTTATILKAPDTLTSVFHFGRSGLSPLRKTDPNTAALQGCTIRLAQYSGASIERPMVFDATASYNIRAIYE